MYTKIQKWGNSHAVRLPKAILEKTEIRENDEVEIKIAGWHPVACTGKKLPGFTSFYYSRKFTLK